MTSIPDTEPETLVLPLMTERLAVTRRRIEHVVQVATVTQERGLRVDEALAHGRIEIEWMPIGRTIGAVPLVREEDDTTVMPVAEEVVVVERRLVLKEEVRIRRVRC